MHTLTLCERVPIPHLPPSNPKPSKSSHCCSSPFVSPFQIKANHSCPKSHLRLSRHARRAWKYRDINDEASQHLSQTVSDLRNEFRFTSHKAVTLMQKEACALDESVAIPSLTDGDRKLSIFGQDPVPTFQAHLSLFHGIEFALLLALLTFQGPQQAVAGSEIAGVMQPTDFIGDLGDISTGFASAFLLIFFSELGDKTFFIAALLASRNSGAIVFVGTFGALAAMTIISVVLGRTFHYVDDILPFRFGETDLPIDDIAAVCLLVYFGVSTLLDAVSSEGLKAEEEQEAELAVSEFSGDGSGSITAVSTVVSTFLLVFVAEWGDKSFFSTIALAAASSPLGVIAGALVGHGVATLLAVVGGSLLGTFISEKVIAYIGGALFLIFALVTLIEIVS